MLDAYSAGVSARNLSARFLLFRLGLGLVLCVRRCRRRRRHHDGAPDVLRNRTIAAASLLLTPPPTNRATSSKGTSAGVRVR